MRLLVSGQSRVGTGPEFEARPGWESKIPSPGSAQTHFKCKHEFTNKK